MSSWFHTKHTPRSSDSSDVDLVQRYLDETPQSLRYAMRSVSLGSRSAYVLPKTVKQCIKNGHTDVELWCYVNPLKRMVVYDKSYRRETWVPIGRTQSIVIDFDDVAGISSCQEMASAMCARDVPLPSTIVQTGPNNFHALYLGHMGDWHIQKRLWLVSKWAQIPTPSSIQDDEFITAIEKSGICANYFQQGFAGHKIRVAGSVNKNHNINGNLWRCVSWFNKNYNNADEQYYREISMPRPNCAPCDNVVSIAAHKTIESTFNPFLYKDAIIAILEDTFPSGFEYIKICDLADMISNNMGWLMRDKYRIHQTSWAKEWGCSQPEVSEILKVMKSCGLLKQIDSGYKKGSYSKTYGAGEILKQSVHWYGGSVAHPEWVRWDEGTANYRMLYDIRYFFSIGLDKEEILKRLNERQAHRPFRKRRTNKDFLRAMNSHMEYVQSHAWQEYNADSKQMLSA